MWRAGGAIAVATRAGGTAQVIALSYGERGESGELWKQAGQTIENVKRVRHAEAEQAAAALGAEFRASTSATTRCRSTPERLAQVADAIREFAPDVLITHTDTDPFNPDHPVAYAAVAARALDSPPAPAWRARSTRSRRRSCSCSSPTSPSCATSRRHVRRHHARCIEAKGEAMAAMEAQQYLQTYYAQRAEQRGNHARRASGDQDVRYAEAFQRVLPQVVAEL